MIYVGSLKGSAASEVDDALRGHEGHVLEALTITTTDEDGDTYEEPFLHLGCKTCSEIILELEE